MNIFQYTTMRRPHMKTLVVLFLISTYLMNRLLLICLSVTTYATKSPKTPVFDVIRHFLLIYKANTLSHVIWLSLHIRV